MSALVFEPRTPFGKLALLCGDGGTDFEIPIEIIDRPAVIVALNALYLAGESKALDRGPIGHEVVVDLAADKPVSWREPRW